MSWLQFINGLESCNGSKSYDNLPYHEDSYYAIETKLW